VTLHKVESRCASNGAALLMSLSKKHHTSLPARRHAAMLFAHCASVASV